MRAFAPGKRQDTAAPVLVSLALLAVSYAPPMGAFAPGKRQDTAAPVLVSLVLLAVSIIPPRADIRKEQPAAARFIFIPIATKRPVVRREITSGRDRRGMTPPKPAQGRLTPPLL